METGTQIYYTGDNANQSGFFEVAELDGSWAKLVEIEVDGYTENRSITTPAYGIGTKYEGHCGTRFVTRKAFEEYRKQMMARYS